MHDDVFQRLQQVVASCLGRNPDAIYPNADFRNDLDADSLDLVELVMAAQGEFAIMITDDEADRIRSVYDAYQLISSKVKGRD